MGAFYFVACVVAGVVLFHSGSAWSLLLMFLAGVSFMQAAKESY